jgi:hypothetical protein
MSKVPNPEESQMPTVHAQLSQQEKEQVKGAHLNEATETLAKQWLSVELEELSKVY